MRTKAKEKEEEIAKNEQKIALAKQALNNKETPEWNGM